MNLDKIKLVVFDCDGVLTDGKIIYDGNKTETKNFHAQDGLGIKMLSFTDIKVAIITGRTSEILAKRCDDLGIEHLYQKVRNKVKKAEIILNDLGLNWENLAYIGDDWNDYPVVKKCGFSSCPANAAEGFKTKVDFITQRNGGEGAVREFIEKILKTQGIYEKTVEKFVEYLENH